MVHYGKDMGSVPVPRASSIVTSTTGTVGGGEKPVMDVTGFLLLLGFFRTSTQWRKRSRCVIESSVWIILVCDYLTLSVGISLHFSSF